jgi:ATP-dependent protease HslVU (ClpYQ) ATPase subunit
LEDLSFEAPDKAEKDRVVTAEEVREKLSAIEENEDLSRYIL